MWQLLLKQEEEEDIFYAGINKRIKTHSTPTLYIFIQPL